jgi:hypothetical protein
MYSEDLYASHIVDHSVLISYCAVFSVMVIGLLLKMTFHTANKEYKYTEN